MTKSSKKLSSNSSGSISTVTLPREAVSIISNNQSFPRPPSIILISNNPVDARRSVLRQSSYASIADDNAKYNAWKQVSC